MVGVAGAPLEELGGLLTTVASEVGVQEVDHGPEVAALLDVDLEEVPEVVEGGGGVAEEALLLDAGGLGVGLGDDQAAQPVGVLAGDLLPGLLALVVAEADGAAGLGGLEEDAPAVVRHLDVVEVRPAVLLHADGGPEVDLLLVEVGGAHGAPPVDVVWLPLL